MSSCNVSGKVRRAEPIAQLVEHLPFKQRVPGSSPGRLTPLLQSILSPSSSLAQDTGLSRRRHGFKSRRGHFFLLLSEREVCKIQKQISELRLAKYQTPSDKWNSAEIGRRNVSPFSSRFEKKRISRFSTSPDCGFVRAIMPYSTSSDSCSGYGTVLPRQRTSPVRSYSTTSSDAIV